MWRNKMYNPYNWVIKEDSIVRRFPYENNSEYFDRMMKEYAKHSAQKSVAMLGIEMAIMNLKDSLSIEEGLDDLYDAVDHDIKFLMQKRKEYERDKYICDKIDEAINSIYK